MTDLELNYLKKFETISYDIIKYNIVENKIVENNSIEDTIFIYNNLFNDILINYTNLVYLIKFFNKFYYNFIQNNKHDLKIFQKVTKYNLYFINLYFNNCDNDYHSSFLLNNINNDLISNYIEFRDYVFTIKTIISYNISPIIERYIENKKLLADFLLMENNINNVEKFNIIDLSDFVNFFFYFSYRFHSFLDNKDNFLADHVEILINSLKSQFNIKKENKNEIVHNISEIINVYRIILSNDKELQYLLDNTKITIKNNNIEILECIKFFKKQFNSYIKINRYHNTNYVLGCIINLFKNF